MEEEVIKTLKQIEDEAQAEMQKVVEPDNPLKELFIQYVGNKMKPENGGVTVEMCVLALAEEFPEFLAPISEQNFMLGYRKCEEDISMLMKLQQETKDPKEGVDE